MASYHNSCIRNSFKTLSIEFIGPKYYIILKKALIYGLGH